MRLQEINSKNISEKDNIIRVENHKNMGLINRHIKEIVDLTRKSPTNINDEYEKLRYKHYHESSVYHFYRKLYESSSKDEMKSLYGYKPIKNITLRCNNIFLKGSVLALDQNEIFLEMKDIDINRKLEETSYFYDSLIKSPLPFIFIPDCNLNTFHLFMKAVFENESLVAGKIIVSESNFYNIMLFEPFKLTYVDLEFFTEELVTSPNIVCFLFGFIYKK